MTPHGDPSAHLKANVTLLLSHLEEGSLAASLVRAYQESRPENREAVLKTVLDERLQALKAEIARAED